MNTKTILAMAVLGAAAFDVAALQNNAPMAMEATGRGGAKILSLDFESDGQAASFSFRVVLPEGAKKIDTSNCLSELPKGFQGVCKEYDGKVVAVTVMNTEGKAFPSGLTSIGKLRYVSNGGAAAVIDTFEASDRNGELAKMGAAKVEKLD
jgi:hypothetical protein